jgi:hypothetical protein
MLAALLQLTTPKSEQTFPDVSHAAGDDRCTLLDAARS